MSTGKGTLTAVSVRIDPKTNQQRTFQMHGKDFYVYDCVVTGADGVTYRGEVNGTTPGTYRIAVGTAVEFEATEGQFGTKMKVSVPQAAGSSGAPFRGGSGRTGFGESPAKTTSMLVQGYLKSLIESGVKSDHWEPALRKALALHDTLAAERLAAMPQPVVAPAPAPEPPAAAAPAKPYVHPYAASAPAPAPTPIGADTEDWGPDGPPF